MVFFRTRLGKILIWQKFSQTWGSHLKTQPTFSRPRLKQMIDLVTWPGISGSLCYLAETVKLAIIRYEGTPKPMMLGKIQYILYSYSSLFFSVLLCCKKPKGRISICLWFLFCMAGLLERHLAWAACIFSETPPSFEIYIVSLTQHSHC